MDGKKRTFFLGLFSLALSCQALPNDPLIQAAQYYSSRYQYQQAYALWSEVFHRYPDEARLAIRVAELKLLFDGREAAREFLVEFISRRSRSLSQELSMELKATLLRILTSFLTNEGQSLYAQAEAKVRRNDCEGALVLLTQAILVEKGNVKVLSQKSVCERLLKLWGQRYETLKMVSVENPFDFEVRDELAEAHLYFKEPQKVIKLLKDDAETFRSPRSRLAYAVALLDVGDSDMALLQFRKLMEVSRSGSFSPMIFYGMGRALFTRATQGGEARNYLEKFFSLTESTPQISSKEWDPYLSNERRAEVQKLLTQ